MINRNAQDTYRSMGSNLDTSGRRNENEKVWDRERKPLRTSPNKIEK
jgi:hypothetical protein